MRNTVYQRRRRQRAGGLKHLKAALTKRASESGQRIARQIIKRKLGETFLIPSLRPKYPTTSELIKHEIDQAMKQARKNPGKMLKTGYRLLRAK